MPAPPKVCKGALLVCGEPGTGKSRWIREEAALNRARLFRWNARVDRSLREGRELLHQQVRSKEPLFVWIEGADDLTQEAQAFLRRILETMSTNVTCALEVRELWKMSQPVLSRCTIIPMKSDTSFRAAQNHQRAIALGLLPQEGSKSVRSWTDLLEFRRAAGDPYGPLQALAAEGFAPDGIAALQAVGGGSSPWIQLAALLLGREGASASTAVGAN